MKKQGNNRSVWAFVAGAGVGALATVLLDPVSGPRRRGYLRDKMVHFKKEFLRVSVGLSHDLNNRTWGLYSQLKRALSAPRSVSDETLVQRVRSEFGHRVTHARSIQVDAAEGVVVLSGEILAHEVAELVDCVRQVQGVKDVINKLKIYDRAETVPSLQGQGKTRLQ